MSRIWAVAKNTIRQAVRLKTVAFLVLALLVVLLLMGKNASGDGTLKGRLQTFVSYSFSLTSLVLSVFTIGLTVYSLTNDIKQKQIFTVLTKPIRRSQLLLGKLLGVFILDFILLAIFSCTIYAVAALTPRFINPSEQELNRAQNEFFTARMKLTPQKIDVSEKVREMYQEMKKSGKLQQKFPNMSQEAIIRVLTWRQEQWTRAVAPGRELIWEFQNVKPLEDAQSLFLKYKYDVSVNPADLKVSGVWFVGDLRQIQYGAKVQTPVYEFARKELIRTYYEEEVPSNVVTDDGYLAVGFLSPPLNTTTILFPEDHLQLLYKADTFTANFIRASLLILLRLAFLACLGIFAASFLSFPVALLLCLAVFTTAHLSGFVMEALNPATHDVGLLYSYTIKPLIHLMPQFDKFSPAKFIILAQLITWKFLAEAFAMLVCIKSFLLIILSLCIFRFREVAKVVT